MKPLYSSLATLSLALLLGLTVACHNKEEPNTPDEPDGDDAAEEAGEAVDDAAEDVEDAAEDAADETEDAVDEAN